MLVSILLSVSNKQTYKRVRLDSNDKDSKSAQVDCPSGDAEACDDKVTPTKFISHISPGKKRYCPASQE